MTCPVFAHHDRIAASKSGDVLIVREPIEAWGYAGAPPVRFEPGQFVRVSGLACDDLYVDFAKDGKVERAVIPSRYFTALDAPSVTRAAQPAARR